MDLLIEQGEFGRLVCTLYPEGRATVVTASDAALASTQLRAALDDLRDTGYGECLWQEQTGDYRWMFRRTGAQVAVVVLWSSGTLTGWQHVLHTETDLDSFERRLRSELAKVRADEPRDRG